MASTLDKLKQHTTIVADSGDFGSIKAFLPQDATTNPSLVYTASQDPKYRSLVDDAVEYAKKKGGSHEKQVRSFLCFLCFFFFFLFLTSFSSVAR